MREFRERIAQAGGICLFGFFLLCLLSPVPLSWSYEKSCRRNMRSIVGAQALYAADHDGRISTAGWWSDDLQPYRREATASLICPDAITDRPDRGGGYKDLVRFHLALSRRPRKRFFNRTYTVGELQPEVDALLKCLEHSQGEYRLHRESIHRGQVLTAYLDGHVRYAPPDPCWDIDRLRAMPERSMPSPWFPVACDAGSTEPVDAKD